MLIKSLITFIVGHLMLIGGVNTRVYKAPEETSPIKVVEIEKTQAKIATSTEKISKIIPKSTTTPIKKVTPQQKTQASETIPDFVVINDFARKATVNIFCTAKGGELSPISGTGAIVEPSGLILTNAHIAQYLLLKDFKQKDFIECVVRTGSPAHPKYTLELVYMSPTWVADNKSEIKSQNPKGTGENDFAFMRIKESIDKSPLPEKFSFIPMNIRSAIDVNEPVLLSSYPAGFLGGISLIQDLNITTAVTNIQDVYTFRDGTIDILAVGGTVVSQKGSSGGMVVDKNGTLIGLISTSSDGDTTSSRSLNAITLSHISRSIQKELNLTMLQFLSQDPREFAETFSSTTAPLLTKILTDEITK